MAIRVDVYTNGGMASGLLARACPLREALSAEDRLQIDDSTWQGLEDRAPRQVGTVNIEVDDILFAVSDEEPDPQVHAAWHHVLLDSGPYTLEGELATMPGFDPGRSLARPTGEFVLLRDVRLSLRGHPEAGVSVGDHALINRYDVEEIRADLMLGFFFPGARIAASTRSSESEAEAAAAAAPVGGAV